ncbi:DUF1727 domain-containing protein, partial [Candidatus Curtissbacteria bacterium]|nr:DUF1727 domain-containing protein [Candidatus Curtissbacteria bacterium]
MDLRLFAAILVGKSINLLINLKGGGGTAAPGLYALKIDPNLVQKLSKNIKSGAIVIAGTNGKTTTARILASLVSAKSKPIHNRQGSNLLRGIASTLIKNVSMAGNLDSNIAIWEADEAALPQIIAQASPKTLVLLNLFRDQLDRYGEVETVREKWAKAISTLPAGTKLILNADDPSVSFLAKSFSGKPIYFGVQEKKLNLPTIENVADVRFCLNCGAKLKYDPIYSSHLGHWSCDKCQFSRKEPTISASGLEFNPDLSTKLRLTVNHQQSTVHYSLPGLYNVYNVLAASAAANNLEIDAETIKSHLESFEAAFGRFQKLTVEGKNIVVFLIKNPAGANEVIRTISPLKNVELLTLLNDNLADGRDVSWIWDTNWEVLNRK